MEALNVEYKCTRDLYLFLCADTSSTGRDPQEDLACGLKGSTNPICSFQNEVFSSLWPLVFLVSVKMTTHYFAGIDC